MRASPDRRQNREEGEHRECVAEPRVEVGSHEEDAEHERADQRRPPAPAGEAAPDRRSARRAQRTHESDRAGARSAWNATGVLKKNATG